jgi:uncharacterized protein (TIGR02246 family)
MAVSILTPEVQAALAAVPQRITVAWAANDASAFAKAFTDDATMVLPGDVFQKGRAAIEAYMAAAYAGPFKGTNVTGRPVDAKLLNEAGDAAAIVTLGGVLQPGESELSRKATIRATWILAKLEGEWLITAYHNSGVYED